MYSRVSERQGAPGSEEEVACVIQTQWWVVHKGTPWGPGLKIAGEMTVRLDLGDRRYRAPIEGRRPSPG